MRMLESKEFDNWVMLRHLLRSIVLTITRYIIINFECCPKIMKLFNMLKVWTSYGFKGGGYCRVQIGGASSSFRNWIGRLDFAYHKANSCVDALANEGCNSGLSLIILELYPAQFRLFFWREAQFICSV